jgi:hypothetical protein
MVENLHKLLEGDRQPGLDELRQSLDDLFGASGNSCRLLDQEKLPSRHSRAYRLRFADPRGGRSVVVKRLEPGIAHRNRLVSRRWLPAIGLGDAGPALIGVAAARSGEYVWHIYEDLGDWGLDHAANRERVVAAAALIARIHTRFAGSPLLPECRLYGGDLGIGFFAASLRDAIHSLNLLNPPAILLASEDEALRDRLLERLYGLERELPKYERALRELGGPETLLHGDLWTTNTFVIACGASLQARLIDWDHAGVGPFSYDLSTFLMRFPLEDRRWILDAYQATAAEAGWRLPAPEDLNLLFDIAENARLANMVIWPAMSLAREQADWGFSLLAEIDEWFEQMQPVLSTAKLPERVPA